MFTLSNKNKTLIFITLLSYSFTIQAQLCDEPSSVETVRIYYANGMNTSEAKSRKVESRIKNILGTNKKSYGRAYNHDEKDIEEFLQFVGQRDVDDSVFWEWYNNLSEAPLWFRERYTFYLNRVINVTTVPHS